MTSSVHPGNPTQHVNARNVVGGRLEFQTRQTGQFQNSSTSHCTRAPRFHVISGSYEVVNIDYGFKLLDIFDPKMSTCASMHMSDGFFLKETHARYLQPTPDNAFMLLGCSKASPLFEGFPDKHLPCRNSTALSCDAFYDCPSWVGFDKKSRVTRSPPCCGIPYSSIGFLNLSRLQCYSYATIYNSSPIKVTNRREWSYGIQLSFSLPEDSDFCRSCKTSKGMYGYDFEKENNICLCDGWNSTTSCDTGWILLHFADLIKKIPHSCTTQVNFFCISD